MNNPRLEWSSGESNPGLTQLNAAFYVRSQFYWEPWQSPHIVLNPVVQVRHTGKWFSVNVRTRQPDGSQLYDAAIHTP